MLKKLLSITVGLTLSLNAFAQVPTLGLTRQYTFTGNGDDSSINVQNGTVYGATLTADRFGNPNSAYNFNGNVSTYISIPATGLNMNEYSYSAWVALNAAPAVGDRSWVLSIGSGSGSTNVEQLLNYNNAFGTPPTTGWIGSGFNIVTPNVFICQGTAATLNTWYHLTFTRSTTEAKFYVNGVLISTTSLVATNTPNYGTGTLQANIGRRRTGTNPFNGKIDDIRIYNRSLDQTEVTALYSETLGINSLSYNTLKVYPNPTENNITIDLGNSSELTGGQVKILNILGQTVFSAMINQQQNNIDLSNLNGKGAYFVHIFDQNNNAIGVKKIILQ